VIKNMHHFLKTANNKKLFEIKEMITVSLLIILKTYKLWFV